MQERVRVMRKVSAVQISGAMSTTERVRIIGVRGPLAASVNGVYYLVDGKIWGERPVYKKEDGKSLIEYLSTSKSWQVNEILQCPILLIGLF